MAHLCARLLETRVRLPILLRFGPRIGSKSTSCCNLDLKSFRNVVKVG